MRFLCCGADDGHLQEPGDPVSLLVPFYVWPDADTYESLAAAGSATIAIVTGPKSGPPDPRNEDAGLYQRSFGILKDAGVRLVGYVHISYGARPLRKALADIVRWYEGQGTALDGIFVDEASNEVNPTSVAYHTELRRAVKAHGAGQLLILNPGAALDARLARQADIVMTFEEDRAVWAREGAKSQRGRMPAAGTAAHVKTAVAVHNTGPLAVAAVQKELQKARRLGYSYVYFTDAALPNPWSQLPTYWLEEVDAVRSACAGSVQDCRRPPRRESP